MSEILTDYERIVWKDSAEDILAQPVEYQEWSRPSWGTFAQNRLRYEATLQAKDAQIAALERVISQRCVDDQACIFADELLTAIKEVTK